MTNIQFMLRLFVNYHGGEGVAMVLSFNYCAPIITGHYTVAVAKTARGAIGQGADTRVIFAGKKNGYGSAVIISHGYKITTLYGHLSTIKVRVGQSVGKGEIIAQQGSTGRSTGEHLHYEVRYKNIPLNPRKFLEAGDQLLNDENNSKYVSS